MSARSIAEQLAEQGQMAYRPSIAAALGEREEAMRLLRQSFEEAGNRGDLMRAAHRAQSFELLRDYPPYQQFMRPRG